MIKSLILIFDACIFFIGFLITVPFAFMGNMDVRVYYSIYVWNTMQHLRKRAEELDE